MLKILSWYRHTFREYSRCCIVESISCWSYKRTEEVSHSREMIKIKCLLPTLFIFIFFRLDANLVIFVSTIIIPIAMFLIPFTHVLGGLALVLSVMGINMGIIDCLANLQMIQMFGSRVGPFLQVKYFSYWNNFFYLFFRGCLVYWKYI